MSKYLAAALCLLCYITTAAQQPEKAVNNRDEKLPAEKLHIHFDKDIYLPGETVWFKAYLHNGTGISAISTNFYTAIYDVAGKLLQQKQYPIFEGTANGDFVLPDSISPAQLQFIAFTKGMQLNDTDNVYHKIIAMAGTPGQQLQTAAIPQKTKLLFFAEGGNAVAGVSNYYSYRAWSSDGSLANCKGVIIETGSNTEVDSFYSNKLGMGMLQFIPRAGKTYMAIWAGGDGEEQTTPLPEAIHTGAVLHAEQTGNMLYYSVTKSTMAANLQTLYLIVKAGSLEIYNATLQLDQIQKYVGKIQTDSLPAGLVQLILQDAAHNNLQQRMLLINKLDKQPMVQHTEKTAAAKAKNSIEITIPDTLLYNLSVSVADVNFYDFPARSSIQTALWLNDDVKAITQPAKSILQTGNIPDADLIMLTNGWNKYSPFTTAVADNYLTLSVDYKEKNYTLPRKEKLNLVIKDSISGNQFYDMEQSTSTSFVKNGLIFYDSARVYYKTTQTKDLENFITLNKEQRQTAPFMITPFVNTLNTKKAVYQQNSNAAIDSFLQGYNQAAKKFNQLQTLTAVAVKSRKWGSPETRRILELDEKYTSGMFSGVAKGYQFNVLDEPNADMVVDIFSYLKYRVPGLTKKGGAWGIQKSDEFLVLTFFVNETETQQEYIQSIPFSSIAYIKVIPGIVIGSSFTTSGGVVYIYLKKGNEPERSATPSMRSKKIKGYDIAREFLQPDYSNKTNLIQPDKRTTLYWNPYLITDRNNNKIKIEYYNNDISKKLLLTIEGFNEEGKLIHIEKIIE